MMVSKKHHLSRQITETVYKACTNRKHRPCYVILDKCLKQLVVLLRRFVQYQKEFRSLHYQHVFVLPPVLPVFSTEVVPLGQFALTLQHFGFCKECPYFHCIIYESSIYSNNSPTTTIVSIFD